MTVSLPTTVPQASVAGAVGSAAPGKGVASAPGQQAKSDAVGAEATEVAGMFAALVAALTQQMQTGDTPAQPPPAGEGAELAAEATPAPPGSIAFTLPGLTGQEALAATAGTTVAGGDAPGTVPAGVPPVPVVSDTMPDLAIADAPTPVAQVSDTPAADLPADDLQQPAAAVADDAPEAAGAPSDAVEQPARAGHSGARLEGLDIQERPAPPSGTIPATAAQPAHAAGPATPAVAATPAATAADADVRSVVGVPTTPLNAAPTTPSEAVAAPAAPPAAAADPHQQIARVVRPLRLGDDGAYELALDLTPAELGRVRIDVELRGATIHLSLRADNPATRELLQSSLDQLRTELESAGLQAGNLDVGGQQRDGRQAATDDTTPLMPVPDEAPATTTTAHSTPTSGSESPIDAGVDVLA